MDNIISDNPMELPEQLSSIRPRNAVILPDGSKPVPLGSGVIRGLLGVGGMANVYEIWNAQLEVSRAVKLLHPNYTIDQKERFQTEIKICAKLHHPNIVEIHAVGAWNGLPFIEMELIKGPTLDRFVADRGALPLETVTTIGILMGRALQYAHNQKFVIYGREYHGIIHRDLKPSNIMIATDGAVKLMDFGIARPTDASIHTTDGAILGTMQYLAPEQLDGKELDIRADIYSLGTILYEMVTGVKAFPEQNVSKLMLSKIRNDFKPLDHFAVTIPARLRRIIHSCLAQDREKRPRATDLLVAELLRIHRSLTADSPEAVMARFMAAGNGGRITIAERKRFPFVRVLLAAGALVLATVVVVGLLRPPSVADRTAKTAAPAPAAASESKTPTPASSAALSRQLMQKSAGQGEVITASARGGRRDNPPSAIELLKERYGTADLMDILKREVAAGNSASALTVYDNLPPEIAAGDQAKVYKLRALTHIGDQRGLSSFLAGQSINDGEFYLARARLLFDRGEIDDALASIDRSLTAPHPFIDDASLRQDALYYRALCRSRQFDGAPTSATLTAALDAWYEVKSSLRTAQDNPYFKKAVSEMQRLHL